MGFHGWNELKEQYLKETEYLQTHFQNIDPNVPFTATDSMMHIAAKIAEVHQESITDTLSLINHDALHNAVRLLEKSNGIHIFCISNLNYTAEEFAFKLKRIGIPVYLNYTQGCIYHEAAMTPSDHCAIFSQQSDISKKTMYRFLALQALAQIPFPNYPMLSCISVHVRKCIQR